MAGSMSYATEVDSLVAVYATIGRDHRASRKRKLAAAAAAAAVVMAGGAALWQTGFELPLGWLPAQDTGTLRTLQARVESELGELSAARAELRTERGRFAARIAELEASIAAFDERYAALEARQTLLASQSDELERALAAVDRERTELLAARERGGAPVDEALAAIGEERQTLENRRIDFAGQRAQLTLELEALEQRRQALQAERAKAEKERAQLETMLESAGRGVPRSHPAALDSPAAPPADVPEVHAGAAPQLTEPGFVSAMVSPQALADLRAGFVTDGGVNIAIGLTRLASVNGEEIVSSSLSFDSLGAALQPKALQSMGQLVVQNGSGNWLAPHLDGVPNSFFGTVVQNTRDNQYIDTATIYDVSIQDVGHALRGFSAMQALGDSLMMQR